MNEYELLRVIDFVERMRAPFHATVPLADEEPAWNIGSHLIRSELRGQLVTISSLAQAAQVPYATARRLIERMLAEELIVRRVRGRTGKSHSLHPSPRLIAAYESYARSMKTLIAATVGRRRSSDEEGDYYFGGAPSIEDDRLSGLIRGRDEEAPLRFLCADDNYFLALRNMWSDLRTNLASTRDFDLRPLPQLYDEIRANAARPESRYDIIAINMPWLAEYAAAGTILPLDGLIREHGISLEHFHPAIRDRSIYDGRTFGIPIYSTIGILAARRDWFEGASLPFPRSLDEVLATGRRFHQPAKKQYGVVWDAARGMPIASSFLFFLGACSGAPAHDDELAALRDRIAAHGVTALDYMRRLLEISPPDALSRAWDANLALFLQGDAAMAYCWTMRATRMEYDIHSTVKRLVEYLPQPAGPRGGRASPIGGFQLAIPANLPEARVETAVAAIGWMTSDQATRAHVRNGFPIAPRFLAQAEPLTIAGSPIVRAVDALAQRQLLSTWQRPHMPQYRRVERILGEVVHQSLETGAPHASSVETLLSLIDKIAGSSATDAG